MSNFVDRYRREHERQRAPKPRKWPLALAGLGGFIVVGMIVLQAALLLFSSGGGVKPFQDSTLALRPAIGAAAMSANNAEITGSGTPMTNVQPPTSANVGWAPLLPGIGAAGLTGLVVFVGLNLLWPGRAATDATGPPDRSTPARPVVDRAEERRWHGGPIRN